MNLWSEVVTHWKTTLEMYGVYVTRKSAKTRSVNSCRILRFRGDIKDQGLPQTQLEDKID
jgi:hypothetical protein